MAHSSADDQASHLEGANEAQVRARCKVKLLSDADM